jgi:uncharacterized protein
MTISLASASIPVFKKMLGNMNYFLEKAEAHATAKKFDVNNFIGMRLTPDMLPFARQVLIACDAAKNGLSRISGVDAPKFDDTEATVAELKARIAKTLAYIDSVPASAVDGQEGKEITFPVGKDATRTMFGEAYLKHWVTPNMYFHVTMAYALLRQGGVDLGKGDFLLGAG